MYIQALEDLSPFLPQLVQPLSNSNSMVGYQEINNSEVKIILEFKHKEMIKMDKQKWGAISNLIL